VFAAAIDFEVEFETITFVDFAQARTFYGTDVHKRIGLPVVTRDEAEALHRVEELDRAGSAFAGQLALGRFCALFDRDHVANNLKVSSRNLPAAINQIEFQRLAFCKTFEACTLDSADVNEHVFAAIFTLNEAEALVCVEELYRAAACSNNLCGHATGSATAATAETVAATAATAEAITAAAATRTAAAEAVATAAAAEAITAAAAETVAAAEVAAAHKGIEAFFTKTVTLVASPTATPSIKTHNAERTFVSPKIWIRQRGRIAPNLKVNGDFCRQLPNVWSQS
jgi:hypothetical protein